MPQHTVDEHFDGRSPAVREIYDRLVLSAREFGPVEEDPKKTSIHLNRRSAFAGVQTRRGFLILTVKAAGDIDDGRIAKREQVSANRWHHEIRLESKKDIDGEIIKWLRDSYEISA
jgi:hypothetical protein